MIQPKEEYLDIVICCPATKKEIQVRFINKELYKYYYDNGYNFIFEEPLLKLGEEIVQRKRKKRK